MARREELLARFAAEAGQVGAVVHRVETAAAAADVVLAVARERDVRSVGTWARRWLGAAEPAAERLAGAGLDVFEREPEVHPGLLALENVALAPHIASASSQTRVDMAVLAVRNCLAVLDGKPPLTPVAS
jgi:hypothetical protein